MSNFSEKLKHIGGLSPGAAVASPPKTLVYVDAVGLVRVANSGVVIAGYPEQLVGTTLITEPDRGKTGY